MLASRQDAGRRPSNLSSSLDLLWCQLQRPAMDIATILPELEAERDQLDRAITALQQVAGSSDRASRPRTRRRISGQSLARIRAAQRARWAKVRGQTKTGRRTMSASARRKIAAAQRARWAKLLGATGKTQVSGDVRGSAHHKIRRP